MTDIADLENRLSAAMDRIANGLSDVMLASGEGGAAELATLRAALEEERAANAQLQERIKVLSALNEAARNAVGSASSTMDAGADMGDVEALREEAAQERAAWQGLNQRLVRMRRSNKLMRSNTLALRQAASDMVVDPELINASLEVELEATIAAQELERAEADVILKTLLPLVNGAAETTETKGDA